MIMLMLRIFQVLASSSSQRVTRSKPLGRRNGKTSPSTRLMLPPFHCGSGQEGFGRLPSSLRTLVHFEWSKLCSLVGPSLDVADQPPFGNQPLLLEGI